MPEKTTEINSEKNSVQKILRKNSAKKFLTRKIVHDEIIVLHLGESEWFL